MNDSDFQEKVKANTFSDIAANRRFLESVFDKIPGTIYIHDLKNDVNLYRSKSLKKLLDITDSPFLKLGKGIRGLVHEDDRYVFKGAGQKFAKLADGDSLKFTYRMQHGSGKWLWLQSDEYVYDRDENGRPTKCLGYTTDLTKSVEQQLHVNALNNRNEFLLQTARILASTNAAYSDTLQELAKEIALHFDVVCDISILDDHSGLIVPEAVYHKDTEVVELLEGLFKTYKVKKGEGLVGKVVDSGEEIFLNDVPETIKKGARKTHPKITPRAMIYRPLKGSDRCIGSLNLTRLEGEQPFDKTEVKQIRQLANHVSLFIDNRLLQVSQQKEIESRKRVESKLARTAKVLETSEQDTRSILNTIPVYIARISKDLRYTFLNESYRYRGVDPLSREGRFVKDCIGEENFKASQSYFERVLKGETVLYDDNRVMEDGVHRYLNVTLSPDISQNGEVQGFYSCSSDITEKIQAKKAAELSEEKFETVTLNSGDAYFLHDIDQYILDVNQAATDMFGYSRKEFFELKASDVDPRWNGTAFYTYLKDLGDNTPVTFETSLLHKDGRSIPVEVRFVKNEKNGNTFVQSLVRDRTEKREQERKLKRSEERLRLIFDNVEDFIGTCDENGIFDSINRAPQGLSREDVIGSSIFTLKGDNMRQDFLREQYENIKKTGESFLSEDEFTGPDGSVVLYSRKLIPIFHEGVFVKTLVITRDVTAQRNREKSVMSAMVKGQEGERKRLGAELHDGIGQILSAISLDVSQISASATSGKKEMVSKELEQLGSKVQVAIKEVRNISHDLMPEVLENFGLKEAIKQVCGSLQSRTNINVVFDYIDLTDRYDSIVESNLYRITQELINNIQKHSSSHNVFISLIDHGKTLNLTVEDDGKGFNTEEESNGIGLRNISARVKMLGGEFDVESAGNSGTLINIEVPKQQE